MKLAKSIPQLAILGATLLALACGSATAGDPPIDTPPESMAIESMAMDSAAGGAAMYDIDDDRDGRTDRTLILEQSDSLA